MIISTEFENTHYGVQEAAGSNPVTRTNSKRRCMAPLFACRFEPAASHFNPPPACRASAGRPLVQIQSLGPRRSKVRFAPTSFYVCVTKDAIRPLPCSSFPTATRCAGLTVGRPPWGQLSPLCHWEISILTVPSAPEQGSLCSGVFLCPRRSPEDVCRAEGNIMPRAS